MILSKIISTNLSRLAVGMILAFLILSTASYSKTSAATTPLQAAQHTGHVQYKKLLTRIDSAFRKLQPEVIRPARGFIQHPYLVPAGYYNQLWDWDGFFIGYHLADMGKPVYQKWWVLNFAKAVDQDGYVPGRITPKGPSPVFGKFAMKPFLSQGALIAARRLHDFAWIKPIYAKLKRVLHYREKTQLDHHYGLYYWDSAGESGADNSVVLTNNPNVRGAVLAADMNTWQLREYRAMAKIAARLGHGEDASHYRSKATTLRKNIKKYLWFPKDDSFWNIRRATGKPIKRVSFQNFVPLIQKLANRKAGRAMIKRYLWNKNYMLSGYGLRSLSRQDPAYNNRNIIVPYSNWRGPIWIVANYLYSVALVKYGCKPQARQLAYMMAKLVLKDIRANGSMHEDYNAETGAPLAPTAKQSGGHFKGFVGWDLLVQDMLKGAVSGQWNLLHVGSRSR